MTGRFFDTPQRGSLREQWLATYRNGLRSLVDPSTGAPFPEADIARATQEGSQLYARAEAVELIALGIHAKAPAIADQIAPSRSTTGVLSELHAKMRDMPRLDAAGATLKAQAKADVGAVFVGSTTIPDASAAFAVDSAGRRYQVLFTVTTPIGGLAGSDPAFPLVLVGVDTGEATNLPAGSKLTWGGNQPLSAAKEFTTTEDGSGGIDAETDAEWAARMEADDAHKPESGNNAHVRKWAREASNAVEDTFVYACAKYAGTKVVAVTQKRGRQTEAAPKGPLARIPSAGTLARVRAYLVPPGSPKVPERVVSVVVAPTTTYTNLSIGLALPRGRGLGWSDVRPWPSYSAGPAIITAIATPTSFTLTTPSEPTGTAPKLMQWVRSISRWEELRVASVAALGVNTWTVTLSSAPSNALTIGSYVSPLVRGYALLALAVERYFDSLGPGEVVAATDTRFVRAARFPDPVERYPYRAGSAILSTLQAALVGTLTSGELLAISTTTPAIPADPVSGPALLVAGHVAVYPSD
jgi:hypothetical protein